jgi:hypothetical protein
LRKFEASTVTLGWGERGQIFCLQELLKSRTVPNKNAIERQIAAPDKQIDQLVHELYGLMEEEIGIARRGLK